MPAGQTAYCGVCGWNRSIAAEEVRQGLLVLPFVFLIFFAVSLFTKRWIGILTISGFALLFLSVSAFRLLSQKRELSKLLKANLIPDPLDSVKIIGSENEKYVVPTRFSHFPSLAVPRRLKMKPVFRYLTFFLVFIALAFADVSYSLLVPPHKAPDDPRFGARIGLISVGISGTLLWGWWLERRRKKLLRLGRVGFALVLGSSAGRGTLLPGITYRFQAETGEELEDFDHDWTDSFHQGMIVPIFYDPLKPENHVAMCASFTMCPDIAQRLLTGITNFSAVWVGEKPTTFTSFRPVLRPAARTSFSVMCFWPLG